MAREDWEVVKLGDVCDNIRKTLWKKDSDSLFLWLEHISQWGLSILWYGISSDLVSWVIKFQKWDILFGKMRPYFRKIVKPNFDGSCSPEFFVIRSNWKINQSYLFYKVACQGFVDKVTASTQWVDRPRAKRDVVKEFVISLPPLAEQQRIASILSAYDDLIENNTRRIALLEQMTQTLYRQWFVEYKFPWYQDVEMIDSGTEFGMIPQGWEVKRIGESLEVKKWRNITLNTISPWNVPVVAWWLSPAYYHNTSNVSSPVITISASWANSWYVNLYTMDIWASDCWYINTQVTKYLYYWYVQLKVRQNEITHLQKWAAQPHVYPSDVMNLLCLNPYEVWIQRFEETVIWYFNEIGVFQKQNQSLKEQRDILLRKLIG